MMLSIKGAASALIKKTRPGDRITVNRDGFYREAELVVRDQQAYPIVSRQGLPTRFLRTPFDTAERVEAYLKTDYREQIPLAYVDPPFTVERDLKDYISELPEIPEEFLPSGGDFMGLIINRLAAVLKNGTGKVRVLDLGCGRGDFLITLCNYLADGFFDGDVAQLMRHVDLVGLSLDDYREAAGYQGTRSLPSNRQTIEDFGINYVVGDMHCLPFVLGVHANEFDCIVSNSALYMDEDPETRIMLLRNIYNLLNPKGGAAFLTGTGYFASILKVGYLRVPGVYESYNNQLRDMGVNVRFMVRGETLAPQVLMVRDNNSLFVPPQSYFACC